MTDEKLIARLREIQGQAGLFASAAADRIEALVKDNASLRAEVQRWAGKLEGADGSWAEAEARAERLEAALRIIGGNNCITCSAVAFNALFAERHPSAALKGDDHE